eukprot:3681813-Amphidinium_carterae.1
MDKTHSSRIGVSEGRDVLRSRPKPKQPDEENPLKETVQHALEGPLLLLWLRIWINSYITSKLHLQNVIK